MIKANVKFFGEQLSEYGMPSPYYSYFIVASPWQKKDSGVATILPLTAESPAPNPPHKIVLKGGAESAYQEMLTVLRLMSQHQGLSELIDKEC